MRSFGACFKKDWLEWFKTGKFAVLTGSLVVLAVIVVIATLYFPSFYRFILSVAPSGLLQDLNTVNAMMTDLFPRETLASLGNLSANMGLFYTLIAVLLINWLLPKEISSGKWIFPKAVGIREHHLILSKSVVSGLGTGLPAAIVYAVYYLVARHLIADNYDIKSVLFNALLLFIVFYSVASITVICSVLYKYPVINAVTMALLVMILPDVLAFIASENIFRHIFLHMFTVLKQR